jgi:hypothetical protein
MSADKSDDAFRRALCADAEVEYMPGIAGMKERDLSTRVRELVDERGLWGFCFYDVRRRSAPGFPDWVVMGAGGVLFRELKSSQGKPSREQRIVGRMLKMAGCSWSVWRPAQLGDGTIARELDAIVRKS